jgi:hypothetical protein
MVVVLRPAGDDDAGVREGPEDVDVEALVADPAVERLDVPVAPGLIVRRPAVSGSGCQGGTRESIPNRAIQSFIASMVTLPPQTIRPSRTSGPTRRMTR